MLDFLYGDYTFVNPVLAKHYGMPTSNTCGQSSGCESIGISQYRPRRVAADVGVLDKECPGFAHQPGETGLLGGPPVAGGGDSAPAAERSGLAGR